MSTAPLFTANATRIRARRPRPPVTHTPGTEVPLQQDQAQNTTLDIAPVEARFQPSSQPESHLQLQMPPQPQSCSSLAPNTEPQSSSALPETSIWNRGYDVRRSAGRSLKSMGGSPQSTPEHSVLILRMGYTQYLQRCMTDGLVWNGSSPASEYTALGWTFSRRAPAQPVERQTIPLPTWSPGDIPLYLYGARGPQVAASTHINITNCRVYYTPVPTLAPFQLSGVIAHYAVPMSILDEMERCVVGYNTFVHRLESPCFSEYSNLAVQMGSSPLVMQSERPLATVEVEPDDWLAVQLEATHYGSTVLCCVPYLSPYVQVEGSLCRDTTCVSTLDRSDYRPVTSSETSALGHVLVPRIKVLCVMGQDFNGDMAHGQRVAAAH